MFETLISTVDRLRLDFVAGGIPRYVGLGEREVSFHLHIRIAPEKGPGTSPKTRKLQIRPPEGFYLAASLPSATVSTNNIWDIDLSNYDQAVDLSFRNNKLSRLDHIVDSSIAALLGVGAGGLISAWLALRVARTNTRHSSD